MPSLYERIEDLELPRLAREKNLDPGIEKLTSVLDKLGYWTLGSCEGHLDGKSHPYPWVTIWGLFVDEKTIERYNKMLEQFNTTSEIKWAVKGMAVRPAIEATNAKELKRLQQSANELAAHLFETFIRGQG